MSVSAVAPSTVSIASQAAASRPAGKAVAGAAALSDAEQRVLSQLQKRDREVRAHEMAHMAAGAGLVTSGASYTYQSGPDGQRYAVGGEVGIDVSPGRTPAATLARAQQIEAAALAPADPSGPDRQIAARAGQMAMEARLEMAAQSSPSSSAGDQVDATYRSVAAADASSGPGNQVNIYA